MSSALITLVKSKANSKVIVQILAKNALKLCFFPESSILSALVPIIGRQANTACMTYCTVTNAMANKLFLEIMLLYRDMSVRALTVQDLEHETNIENTVAGSSTMRTAEPILPPNSQRLLIWASLLTLSRIGVASFLVTDCDLRIRRSSSSSSEYVSIDWLTDLLTDLLRLRSALSMNSFSRLERRGATSSVGFLLRTPYPSLELSSESTPLTLSPDAYSSAKEE